MTCQAEIEIITCCCSADDVSCELEAGHEPPHMARYDFSVRGSGEESHRSGTVRLTWPLSPDTGGS